VKTIASGTISLIGAGASEGCQSGKKNVHSRIGKCQGEEKLGNLLIPLKTTFPKHNATSLGGKGKTRLSAKRGKTPNESSEGGKKTLLEKALGSQKRRGAKTCP